MKAQPDRRSGTLSERLEEQVRKQSSREKLTSHITSQVLYIEVNRLVSNKPTTHSSTLATLCEQPGRSREAAG